MDMVQHPQFGRGFVSEIVPLDSLVGGGFAVQIDGRFSDHENNFVLVNRQQLFADFAKKLAELSTEYGIALSGNYSFQNIAEIEYDNDSTSFDVSVSYLKRRA